MPDDNDRPGDAAGAAGAGSSDARHADVNWANATAPDDISSLTRDIQAYRREQRAARRRARYGRFSLGPAAAPLTLTITVLAIIAIAATILTVIGPHGSASPTALPLAKTTLAFGTEGGLLPAADVTASDGTSIDVQSLRPGVIAVLPSKCGCSEMIRTAAAQASSRNLNLYAVVPSGQKADADALKGVLNPTAVFIDASGQVEKSILPSGPALVLVNRDGKIYKKQTGTDLNTDSLPNDLLHMLETGG